MRIGDLARLSDPTPQYETWRNRVGVIRDVCVGNDGNVYADWQPSGEPYVLRITFDRLTRIEAATAAEVSG